jgi:hypothetical protein
MAWPTAGTAARGAERPVVDASAFTTSVEKNPTLTAIPAARAADGVASALKSEGAVRAVAAVR